MAKKGYPGLVLVPPSDRTILRQRLLWGGLFFVAVLWGASVIHSWLPSSSQPDCQTDSTSDTTPQAQADCTHNQTIAQTSAEEQPHQNTFTITEVPSPTDANAAESQSPLVIQAPEPPKLMTEPTPEPPIATPAPQPALAPPAPQKDHTADRTVTPSQKTKAAIESASSTLTASPDHDIRLAERGDAFAQYRLGRFYAQQKGPQAQESVKWYKKASTSLRRLAENGNGQAMYVLGVMYANGKGVTRDPEEARRWLTQAVVHHVAAARPVLASLEKDRPVAHNSR